LLIKNLKEYNVHMLKIFKWIAIVIFSLFALVMLAGIVIGLFIPVDKIKDWATGEMSRSLHRQVTIQKVGFNIFSGIKLEGIAVSNEAGFSAPNLMTANSFSVKYSFWGLFAGKLLVNEIGIDKLAVTLEKNSRGVLNYADLVEKKAKKSAPSPNVNSSAEALNKLMGGFLLNHIRLSDSSVAMLDFTGTKLGQAPKKVAAEKINFEVSGITLSGIKPLSVSGTAVAIFDGKSLPIGLRASVKANPFKQSFSLSKGMISIGPESLEFTINGQDLSTEPKINFQISSDRFALEPSIALFAMGDQLKGPKPAAKPGELTATINNATKGIPANLSLDGQVKVSSFSFKDLAVDQVELALGISRKKGFITIRNLSAYGGKLTGSAIVDLGASGTAYRVKDLKLTGFQAGPFFNAITSTFVADPQIAKWMKDRASGTLTAAINLQGQGVEMPQVLSALDLTGSLDLSRPNIRKFDSLAEQAKTWNIALLQNDLALQNVSAQVKLSKKVVTFAPAKLNDNDIKVVLSGAFSLPDLIWQSNAVVSVFLSPKAAAGIPAQYNFMKEKNGDTRVDLGLSGSLKRPGISIILKAALQNALDKLQNSLQNKLDTMKQQQQDQAQKEINKQTEKAKKDAENQLKNMFTF
jgi:hypothetical protein